MILLSLMLVYATKQYKENNLMGSMKIISLIFLDRKAIEMIIMIYVLIQCKVKVNKTDYK